MGLDTSIFLCAAELGDSWGVHGHPVKGCTIPSAAHSWEQKTLKEGKDRHTDTELWFVPMSTSFLQTFSTCAQASDHLVALWSQVA